MGKLAVILLLLICICGFAAEQRMPAPYGKGLRVLMLHGWRPESAQEIGAFLARAGCEVTVLDSRFLDGLGGASIKHSLSDINEPEPYDGITPAMARLKDYKLVFVTAIAAQAQKKLFSPERIRLIKDYLAQGGTLLVNYNAPAELDDLLPVKKLRIMKRDDNKLVKRPYSVVFQDLPPKWPLMGNYYELKMNPASEVVSSIINTRDKPVGIYLAVRGYGKGQVFFMNDDWTPEGGLSEWEHAKSYLISLISYTSNIWLNK